MDLLKDKTERQLLESLIAELAKAQNEMKCARGDLEKAQGRQKFLMAVLHELINRSEI
jgi:hypothetical protein